MKQINLSLFNNILADCKNIHWVTNSYAKHMALDEAYDDFKDAFDKYVEVALGIFGRDAAIATNITPNLIHDDKVVSFFESEFVDFNNALYKITGDYSQLQSIFDDIKGIENQLIYRLSMD